MTTTGQFQAKRQVEVSSERLTAALARYEGATSEEERDRAWAEVERERESSLALVNALRDPRRPLELPRNPLATGRQGPSTILRRRRTDRVS